MTAGEADGLTELGEVPDPYPVQPVRGPLDATVVLPGSKSLTNRALVCAALADGPSTLDGILFADDTEAMLGVLSALGIDVTVDRGARRADVDGCDGRVPAGPVEVDVRQSGTTARFVPPMLALGDGPYRVVGHPQLLARPMAPTLDALRSLGVAVEELAGAGRLPVTVRAGAAAAPSGPDACVLQVAGDVSSQFLSGLLLVGPCLPEGLVLEVTTPLVSRPYVEMTVAVMSAFGARVDVEGDTFMVEPGGYRATSYNVEADASAASYMFAAAAICGGRVRVDGLGRHAVQGDLAFVDLLAEMGANVRRDGSSTEVIGTGTLHGVEADMADLSDTAPTLAAVAPFADSPTRVTGIGFIRRKETDRVAAVVTELRRCGIDAVEEPDGWLIRPGQVRPVVIETYDDHRMAMSFALLGLRVPGIAIANPACVAKTFPGYWDALEHLGS